jgi:hypothetical protein
VSAAGATLTGSVSPEGEPVIECFFEYGETEGFGADRALHRTHRE